MLTALSFGVIFILIVIIISKNSTINHLRSEIDALKQQITLSEPDDEDDDFELTDYEPDPLPINYEPDNSHKVDWERAQELQSRAILGHYLKPLKDLEDKSHFFYGKKVVISGVYDEYPDRNDLAQRFWIKGADIDRAIGKRTEFLIIGDDAGPRKIEKAKEQGITIITQDELIKYFPEGNIYKETSEEE